MAKLDYNQKTYENPNEIKSLLQSWGVPFEQWLGRKADAAQPDEVLKLYDREIKTLMQNRGYVSCDVIALDPSTPNLETILQKFDKEHHHYEDEVRYVVAGEGVFEISDKNGQFAKFTAQPGDLIVIPANRRHLFYLTEKKNIRCIRLFKTKEGWEAIYKRDSICS